MTENNQEPDSSEALSAEFSWEALPELAKDRWEQMVAYSSAIENQLVNAKASRSHAETERQRIANEILSATKDACQEIVADAKRAMDKINSKTEEAERNHQEAKLQLDEANSIRTEAESYKEAVLARAEKQAEELMQRAQAAAEAAGTKLKQQVTFEAQRMLAQAEAMRAAAAEELEAQRIYAEAALLKADAHQALDQLKAQSPASEPFRGVGSAEPGASPGVGDGLRQISGADNSKAHAALSIEAPAQATAQDAGTESVTNETDRSVPEGSNPESAEPELTPMPPENGEADRNKNDGTQKARIKDRQVRAA